MSEKINKTGFVFVDVSDVFDVEISEEPIKVPAYYMTNDAEYAQVLDVDESAVQHHINVRYEAAIRGMSVVQYREHLLKQADEIGNREMKDFFNEVFDL